MSKPIKILRPGTFTDIHGQKVTFTASDLAEVVSSYDAAEPAPLVIGHPKSDDPAQGWVESLAVDGDGFLTAVPQQVAPAFAEMVTAGRYRRISPSLYPPKDPNNPSPGKWRLKHVGFLGAQAPAVKGLGTVAFSEEQDAASVTVELSEEESGSYLVELAEREAQITAREEAIAAREAGVTEREDALGKAASDAAHTANVSFAEGLSEKGLLAPRGVALVVGILDQLGEAAEPVSFGEGGDAVSMTPIAAFRSLFDAAHPIVAFGEHAPADTAVTTERDPAKLAQAAVAFMESEAGAGRTITIQAAVRHVEAAAAD